MLARKRLLAILMVALLVMLPNLAFACDDGCEPRTPGFWKRDKSEAIINDLGFDLGNLILVDATGRLPIDNFEAFQEFMKKRTAEDMNYQLSAQLAAAELNVAAGFIDPGIYGSELNVAEFSGTSGGTLMEIIEEARKQLDGMAIEGYSLEDNERRAYLEALKDALDAANNGKF